ncbi:hypothetical protein BJX68DRAFT_258607 [Aspergillus pseudodeflectus]|uniref:Uncharacterized protein n=1 Tax=Aspergillus pseudodeflectus TaxID=176178 RepID=A0ABR4JJ68_9EURO
MDASQINEAPGYVRVAQWPNLKALAEGYGKHLMAESRKLSTAPYKAFEVRANTYLIDFNNPNYEEQVRLVASLSTGQVLVGISGIHNIKEGCKRTWTPFSDASIEEYADVTPFAPTADLISKHILYRYAPRDGTSTSTQIREKGLADTEPCKMLKLDEQLGVIMPVESIAVVDLEKPSGVRRFVLRGMGITAEKILAGPITIGYWHSKPTCKRLY